MYYAAVFNETCLRGYHSSRFVDTMYSHKGFILLKGKFVNFLIGLSDASMTIIGKRTAK